jgi:integrase
MAKRAPASRKVRVEKPEPRTPCPQWLADLRKAFKAHRFGRPGWFVTEHRGRLRLTSHELPPRPDEPPAAQGEVRIRHLYLNAAPGPTTIVAAASEACAVFDAVLAGEWQWPDPEGLPAASDPSRLQPSTLQRLVSRLQTSLVGERIGASTWERTYLPFLSRLVELAAQRAWCDDRELIAATLRLWQPGSRSRQMAHDRIRALWKLAGWPWPEGLQEMRGSGKAAADPQGVRAFTDEELTELRARIQRSQRLTPADLVAWDCLAAFGLRPAELKGLELVHQTGALVARVTRQKRSSKGSSGARTVPAVPPGGWPADCYDLLGRWREHGLPPGMVAARSPGQVLTQQLRRLRQQQPVAMELDAELTAYGCRHAFALRLGLELSLDVRSAAALMGHSPATHLAEYGRRLDTPALHGRVAALVQKRSAS